MNVNGIGKLSFQQSAEEWRNLLKKTQYQNKGKTDGRSYIVLNGTKHEAISSSEFTETIKKISVVEITEISQRKFTDLKGSLDKQINEQGYLTNEQVKKFSSV